MPKFLKFIAVLGVLGALALNPSTVSAQRIGNSSTPVNALVVMGGVTTAAVAQVDLTGSSAVAVQLTSVSGVANTSNTIVTVDRSLDGSNWVTGYSTLTLANTGTTTANCISNYTVGADAYWRLNVQNAGLAAVSNTITIKVNRKPGL